MCLAHCTTLIGGKKNSLQENSSKTEQCLGPSSHFHQSFPTLSLKVIFEEQHGSIAAPAV
jgi:hypothetical protein